MANRKELVLEQMETGCVIPTSHKLNPDGYFRKRVWVDGKLKLMMYHRYVWLEAGNEIPKGHEIDHICRNRACCNVEHLQVLGISEHKVKTNVERSKDRIAEAKDVWLNSELHYIKLAEQFEVSPRTTLKWIKKWRQA